MSVAFGVCVCVEIQQRTIYQFSLKRQMEAVKRRLLLFILCGMRFFYSLALFCG